LNLPKQKYIPVCTHKYTVCIPYNTPLVDQRWVNLCHPLAQRWNQWLVPRRFGRWTQRFAYRWLELTHHWNQWLTRVILCSRLLTLDPRCAKIGAMLDHHVGPPVKMMLDQQLRPTLGHQACVIWAIYRFCFLYLRFRRTIVRVKLHHPHATRLSLQYISEIMRLIVICYQRHGSSGINYLTKIAWKNSVFCTPHHFFRRVMM